MLFLTCLLTEISAVSNSIVDKDSREKLEPYSGLSSEESYQSRDLEKVPATVKLYKIIPLCNITHECNLICATLNMQVCQQVAKPLYDTKVQPTTLIPKQLGNMYTASLYAAFASVVHNKHDALV